MQYIQLQGQVAAELDTPLAGGFNLFVDASDNTIKVKDSQGNLAGGGISLIEITRAELLTAIGDEELVPGAFYKISGVATGSPENFLQQGGTTIILQAINSSLISSKGFGLFWNPNYDTIDVWDNTFRLEMAFFVLLSSGRNIRIWQKLKQHFSVKIVATKHQNGWANVPLVANGTHLLKS